MTVTEVRGHFFPLSSGTNVFHFGRHLLAVWYDDLFIPNKGPLGHTANVIVNNAYMSFYNKYVYNDNNKKEFVIYCEIPGQLFLVFGLYSLC